MHLAPHRRQLEEFQAKEAVERAAFIELADQAAAQTQQVAELKAALPPAEAPAPKGGGRKSKGAKRESESDRRSGRGEPLKVTKLVTQEGRWPYIRYIRCIRCIRCIRYGR